VNHFVCVKKYHRSAAAAAALVLCSVIVSLSGCYSFTGSSVPKHLKTIAIALFDDQSGFGEAGVREQFTSKLIDLFTSDNNLEIADKTNADSILEGTVTAIRDDPAVIAAGEQTKTRRVTISVHASYTDMKLRKKVWERDFSQWGDYAPGTDLRTVAITAAVNKISEDILIETVSGW
jgi:hypothetical protein